MEWKSEEEVFTFDHNGKVITWMLQEVGDGFWNFRCEEKEFIAINGSDKISNTDSLTDALEKMDVLRIPAWFTEGVKDSFIKRIPENIRVKAVV